ncbi:MAG: nickel-responsive transcriptional regulator NikR [Bauldia sp.]|nr:nickel-responsive transcriptional regulator NikR [Bauldia sp.]
MQRVTITIDDDLLGDLDALIAERGYQSRSEAVRDIVRETLAGSRRTDAHEHVVASLSYVYDHHKRELAKRLTESQHEHHDLTVASLHVHLDETQCLEIAVLKGHRTELEELADEIISQRGVRYGKLHVIPAAWDEDAGHSHSHEHGHHHAGGHPHK